MSVYGHVNDTTPFIRELSNKVTVYSNARSPSIGSRPSHASLFTGYHAIETGISGERKLRPGTTIWEELDDEGYDTAVFSDNPFLRTNRYGLISGFNTVRTRSNKERAQTRHKSIKVPFSSGLDPQEMDNVNNTLSGVKKSLKTNTPIRSLLNGVSLLIAKRSESAGQVLGLKHGTGIDSEFKNTSARNYITEFDDWLMDHNSPWAACINLMDAHYPYVPASQFDIWGSAILRKLQAEWAGSNYAKTEFHDGDRPWWQLRAFESLYDGSIRQLDNAISKIVEILKRAGALSNTLLVITSDHGETFGERSYFEQNYRLVAHGADGGIHDERTHVPLLVKYPEQKSGCQIDSPASLTTFPAVVRAVRDGDWHHDEFVPDGPVFVTLDSGYEQQSFAMYETHPDGVQMHAVRESDTTSIIIRSPQNKCVEPSCCCDITEIESSFNNKDISVSQDEEDIDDEVRAQLSNLGYV
jgi:arylsulfatase